MSKRSKYYVVWKGRRTGIFRTWEECEAQVSGYTGAEYMAFNSLELAKAALASGFAEYQRGAIPSAKRFRFVKGGPEGDSIAVDASCPGNPGPLEYRGVHIGESRVLFHRGSIENGTNNIGEFLAIVQALEWLTAKGRTWPVYSDSQNAIAWVRGKKCRTKLPRNAKTAKIFSLIGHAEAWLRENVYPNRILKWKTEEWGEIPADFARK